MTTKNSQKHTLPNGYISKANHDIYDVQDNFQTSPAYLASNPKAFHIRVHVNNEVFEPGKKMTVQANKIKTFENFLEECTEKIKPPFGAARRLYTARGRHRIQKLDELTEDNIYVITGNEPFKRHNYKEIPERVAHVPGHKGYKKIDLSRIYTPVQHALEERLRKKSGRSYYQNEHRRGLRLRVHVNGMNERPSCPVSIRYKDKDNFPKILEEIEVTMNLQPIDKIYKVVNQGGYAENFVEVTDASQLEADEHILVLPKNEKKLQVKLYSLEGKNNFKVTTSPRSGQYYLYPSFPVDNSNFHHSKSLNKHKPLPSIGSSKNDTMSPLSNPPGSQGGKQANKNKSVKQVDYDKDEGGVYRAKKQNNTQGAPQHRANNDAGFHRNEDDSFNHYDHKASGPHSEDPWATTPVSHHETHRKQEHQQQAAAKIQAGARGYIARKEYKAKKAETQKQEAKMKVASKSHEQSGHEKGGRQVMSQDLAASKIQASFKGYKTRKEVNEKRRQGQK